MSTSSRDSLARGDLRAVIESLGPDEEFTLALPAIGGTNDLGGWYARIGRTQVAVRNDGEVQVHVHEDEESAARCFTWNIDRATRLMATVTAAGDDPMAVMLALANALTEDGDPDDEDTVPVSPYPLPAPVAVPAIGRAPVVYVATDGPPNTGMYL